MRVDGGGVRGLSSFIPWKIFDKLEERLGERKKPCKIFDMIGGTSTGGYVLHGICSRILLTSSA